MAWWFWHDMQLQLDSPLNIEAGTAISYTIEPGMNLKIIGEDLVQQGLLEHRYYLILEGRLQGSDQDSRQGNTCYIQGQHNGNC